jgi:hypothetical protein
MKILVTAALAAAFLAGSSLGSVAHAAEDPLPRRTPGDDPNPPTSGWQRLDPKASATTTDASCSSASDGAIDVAVRGGTAPFRFSWSNGATTEDLSGLGPGTYSVTVTDAAGHAASLTASVAVADTAPPAITPPSALRLGTGPGATAAGRLVSDAELGVASASDLCAGAVPVLCSGVPAGNWFPVGTTMLIHAAADPSGNWASASQTVTVLDDTPPVIACPDAITAAADSSGLAVVTWSPVVTDNCPGVGFISSPPSGAAFPVGTTEVRVTATDAAGNSASRSFAVTVAPPNGSPSVRITAPASGSVYAVRNPVGFTGAFSDESSDTHTAEWTFGAIAVAGVVTESNGSVAGSWVFGVPGVYSVRLAVRDQEGRSGVATTVNGREAAIVIYDPAAGSVKGSGRIDSPAGAYAADPGLAGRADFRLDCKYHKGATAPAGSARFQLKVGKLDLHGDTFEWLAISGASVQLAGSGTVNGAGGYDFLITAVDGQASGGGGTDRLRLRITSRATGDVLYDNQRGAADTAAPTQALAAGRIVIDPTKGARAAADPQASVEPAAPGLPIGYVLAQNAPNPFRARTELRFGIPTSSRVKLAVYDLAGREVASLADGVWEAGYHSVSWTGMTDAGESARGGVYFVRMVGRSLGGGQPFVSIRKMILLE